MRPILNSVHFLKKRLDLGLKAWYDYIMTIKQQTKGKKQNG